MTATASSAWLRNERFDYRYIVGVALIAVTVGVIAQSIPRALPFLFIADVALLGWHHVVASFTRLAHHPSAPERRFLLFVLPPIVIGLVALSLGLLGASLIGAVYFYWQTFHYARQVWGVDRLYARKAGQLAPDRLTEVLVYLIAGAAMSHRSLVGVVNFGGQEIHFLPIPFWFAWGLDGITLLVALAWIGRAISNPEVARVKPIRATFMATYALVFALGYGVIGDFLTGWVVVNIWHNLQYVVLVRILNEDRFAGDRRDTPGWVARSSQPAQAVPYFALMVALGVLLTVALESLSRLPFATLIPLTFAASMSFNFHHYIVDGIIWRTRKPAANG